MSRKFYTRALVIGAIFAVVFTFVQLPYYITKPGMAQELEPLVEVENGYDEEGSFMLTTVRMGKANIFSYLWAKASEYHHIYPINEIRREGESDDEYTYRQLHLMEGSKEAAISVAYKYAKKEITYQYNGVYVLGIVPDMPAEEVFVPGDRIYKVDETTFETAEEFIEYVSAKKEGDQLKLVYERDGTEHQTILTVSAFPDNPEEAGVGISLVTDREIVVEPDIMIDTEKIGGPSAGLMFSLEIYNQLIEKDLTNGLRVAGTGTINDQGKVGRIGGISQKIVAASKSEVDIFFAPNEKGVETSNYLEAIATAKDIKTDMKIIPVDTFEDALHYLEKLQPK